MKTHKTVTDSA